MKRLSFVVPVHGRVELTGVCLRQLARTCVAAREHGLAATAVVVGDDENVETAEGLGFDTVRRSNIQLGTKFNDGYQFACDPQFNPRPADYVVPCGSDDWIDPVIFRRLPTHDTIGCFRQIAVVNEQRTRISKLRVDYNIGAGIKIIPASLIAKTGYRPAEEDRNRALDASTHHGIVEALGRQQPRMAFCDVHEVQIVDWKSRGTQLNPYEPLRKKFSRAESGDVWGELAAFYPAEALEEMRDLLPAPVAA